MLLYSALHSAFILFVENLSAMATPLFWILLALVGVAQSGQPENKQDWLHPVIF